MKPPFIGTKIVDNISLQDVIGLIDRDALFISRWELRGDLRGDGWKKRVDEVANPTFERIAQMAISKDLIEPKIVYGHFECKKSGNLLFVNFENVTLKFDFPRERKSPNRCLADFFPDGFVTMQLVTVGNKSAAVSTELFKRDKYVDAFYMKGFAAEACEALAKYSQRFIASELGLPEDAGVRFSFGYPACPNLMDQEKLVRLLSARRIGVVLSRTMHLIPEHSTSAIISFDKNAARFIP